MRVVQLAHHVSVNVSPASPASCALHSYTLNQGQQHWY
jgi:hypothetical protein